MATIYKVKTVEALFTAAQNYMIGQGSSITNFNEGARVRILLEAIAQILHQAQFDFLQGLQAAIPISVFQSFEFDRLGGIQATGQLEFTRSSPAAEDFPIPAGTRVVLNGVSFETSVAGAILTGLTTSGNIDSNAVDEGVDGNIGVNAINVQAGQGSFASKPNGIENVTNPVAFTGGEAVETDEARLKRFREFVNALARSTPQGIIAGVNTVSGVASASLVENFPSAGFFTVFVDDGSGNLPAPLKAEVEKVINGDPLDSINYPGYRPVGVTAIVDAPTVLLVDVTVDLRILNASLANDADLENLANTAIANYVNTLGLGFDVVISELIKAIKNTSADIYDVLVTLPVANIAVGDQEVPRTDTITVTSQRIDP